MVKKAPKPKRHFGVRDPLKQLEERENAIKDKINNPPAKDENQQALSQKMKKFIQLKKDEAPAKKKPKKDTLGSKAQVVRQPGETEEAYLKRLNRFKNSRLSEALYAAKYNVKITRNEATGELSVKQGVRNEIDDLLLAKKLGKRKLKKKAPEQKKAGLLKLKQKKKQKKLHSREEDPLRQVEVIPFGERVDAPPTLVTPRKATKDSAQSKNKRNGLLLAEIINPKAQNKGEPDKKAIDFKKVMLERERESIVKMYKEIKAMRRVETGGGVKKYLPGSSL